MKLIASTAIIGIALLTLTACGQTPPPETPQAASVTAPATVSANYLPYTAPAVTDSLAQGKKVALFFHASWCPSCRALDSALKGETLPADLVVYKVDYDTAQDLRTKYGVTSQHTLVALKSDMSALKVQVGAEKGADIIALFENMVPETKKMMEETKSDTASADTATPMMDKTAPAKTKTMKDAAPEKKTMTDTAAATGMYTAYSETAVKSALADGKKVALFFHASWCPSCRALDSTLKGETLPADLVVYKVDYDATQDLRKKYGVTSQHTLVALKSDMSAQKVQVGAQDSGDIIALWK